ncbi:MAG TPA: 2-phosphosulfolactate phosphatase [Acidimicrobiales bacterium]|jgi:2-phosphosulfolactate phosphatase|nr:2-phosphosulfolactate phosphatase [Acidimicrobiales bacterium]
MPPTPARTVVIDCFPEAAARFASSHAVVSIDVIRATTTAITALIGGRRVYPVPTIEAAVPLAARLDQPLLVGELGGSLPYGFHVNNSPARMAERTDVERPMILLSTSGTRLVHEAAASAKAYVASLRNWGAQAAWLAEHDPHVALIGAGARGEFREEDALCCGWIGAALVDAGYEVWDEATADVIERWRAQPAEAITASASAEYLRETGQYDDLDFILAHVDDVDAVFVVDGDELKQVGA